MTKKFLSRIFCAVAILLLALSPRPLFAKSVNTELQVVFWSRESSVADLFVKSGGIYRKLNGAAFALPKSSLGYSGESVVDVFEKSGGGYVKCAEFEIPEGAQKCLVAIGPATRFFDSDEDLGYEPKYGADAMEFVDKGYGDGTLSVLNFSTLSLRARVVGCEPVVLKPKTAEKIYSLPGGEKSADVDFRIVTAAKDAESAHKAWRVGNSMRVVSSQRYFIAVVPGRKREGKPPQCEIFSIRAE